MSGNNRAVIQAELKGTDAVVADAKKIGSAVKDVGAQGGGVASSLKDVGGAAQSLGAKADSVRASLTPTALLGGFLGGALATGLAKVGAYLGEASDKAKSFQERTAVVARRTGADVGTLRDSFQKNSVAVLQSTDAQADFVESLQRTTYQGQGAAQSLYGIGAAATVSGRTLQEMVPIVAALQTGLNVQGDTSDELERITSLAQRLKTVGGPQALQDSIAALAPAMANVAFKTDEARAKFEAFLGVLSQGRKPGQAQAVAAGAIGMIKGRANEIAYTLKRQVLDENGNVNEDEAVKTLSDLRKVGERKYKGDKRAMRRAMIAEFGPDLGSAIMNTDYDKVNEQAQRSYGNRVGMLDPKTGKIESSVLAGPNTTDLQLAEYKRTAEGARAERDARGEARARDVGASILRARDSVGEATDTLTSQALGSPTVGQVRAANPVVNEDSLATKIGRETAAALRAAPLVAKMPMDPNAPKGN